MHVHSICYALSKIANFQLTFKTFINLRYFECQNNESTQLSSNTPHLDVRLSSSLGRKTTKWKKDIICMLQILYSSWHASYRTATAVFASLFNIYLYHDEYVCTCDSFVNFNHIDYLGINLSDFRLAWAHQWSRQIPRYRLPSGAQRAHGHLHKDAALLQQPSLLGAVSCRQDRVPRRRLRIQNSVTLFDTGSNRLSCEYCSAKSLCFVKEWDWVSVS